MRISDWISDVCSSDLPNRIKSRSVKDSRLFFTPYPVDCSFVAMLPETPARLSGISKGARMVQMRSRSRFRCALLAAVAIGTLVPGASALAQDQRRVEYRIEAGDLGEAQIGRAHV